MAVISKTDLFNGLIAKGYAPAAAAAAVGHASWESGRNTSNDTGDGGTSGGLFQWHNERWTGLKDYAAKQGTDWTDPQTQIDYFHKEVTSNPAWSGLPQEQDYGKAHDIMFKFESPKDPSASAKQRWQEGAGLLDNPPEYSAPQFETAKAGSGSSDGTTAPADTETAAVNPDDYKSDKEDEEEEKKKALADAETEQTVQQSPFLAALQQPVEAPAAAPVAAPLTQAQTQGLHPQAPPSLLSILNGKKKAVGGSLAGGSGMLAQLLRS